LRFVRDGGRSSWFVGGRSSWFVVMGFRVVVHGGWSSSSSSWLLCVRSWALGIIRGVVAGGRRFWAMVVVCERWRSFWVVEVVLGGGSRSFWGRCRRGPFVEPAVCCGDVAPFLSSLVVGVCRGGGGPSTTVVCHVVTATWR
jgi:hypothetical protein